MKKSGKILAALILVLSVFAVTGCNDKPYTGHYYDVRTKEIGKDTYNTTYKDMTGNEIIKDSESWTGGRKDLTDTGLEMFLQSSYSFYKDNPEKIKKIFDNLSLDKPYYYTFWAVWNEEDGSLADGDVLAFVVYMHD